MNKEKKDEHPKDGKIRQTPPPKAEEALNDWERMKAFVGAMIADGRELGLTQDQLIKMSVRLVDNSMAHFPSDSEDEDNWRRIWGREDEESKEMMVQMMFTLCDPESPLSKMHWEKLARLMAKTVNNFMNFVNDL